MPKGKKKKKPKKRKDKKPKKPKKRKNRMALELHYTIRQSVINHQVAVEDTIDLNLGILVIDDVTGLPVAPEFGQDTTLDTPAIKGQVTAIKAIILAATKQTLGTQNVEFAEPPEEE